MPHYLMIYRGPAGYVRTPESTSQWRSWFDGMGDQLVELGNPAIEAVTVGNCDPESTELGGYSIIDADDLEAALVVAKGCPHLGRNGGVEVARVIPVPPAA
jgi:hypothetical protein